MERCGAGWDKGFLWFDDSRGSGCSAALGRASAGKSSDFSLISFLKKSLAAPGGFAYFERSGRKATEVKYISTFLNQECCSWKVFPAVTQQQQQLWLPLPSASPDGVSRQRGPFIGTWHRFDWQVTDIEDVQADSYLQLLPLPVSQLLVPQNISAILRCVIIQWRFKRSSTDWYYNGLQ